MWRSHLNHIWRLFFMQSSRNERTQDGLGFYHALSPRLASDPRTEAEHEAIRRHIGYFNANPITASYVVGAVVNMERRRQQGEALDGAHIERIKGALSAVLTAKGDYFFSMVLLPLGLTTACIFAMYSSYLGPIIFLALYNYYHLRSRIGGYLLGVRLGEELGRGHIGRIYREQGILAGCAAFVAGVFTALAFVRASSYGGFALSGWGIVAVALFWLLRRRISVVLSVIIVFVIGAAYLLIV